LEPSLKWVAMQPLHVIPVLEDGLAMHLLHPFYAFAHIKQAEFPGTPSFMILPVIGCF